MRIATWNVNGLRARFEYVQIWLEARSPDVVALQELRLADDQFPALELQALGYNAVFLGEKARNGVAILARERPELLCRGLPGQEAAGARFLTARVTGIAFTSVYCPNGKHVGHQDFPHKLAWFDSLATHLETAHDAGEPLLMGGDFNVCRAPIDSWNEETLHGSIFHTDEERARLDRVLGWGLHDVFRERHPDLQAFSWWDYRGGAFHRRQGLRIDLVLATRPLLERVRSIEIDRDFRKKQQGLIPSDHAPVIVDLD